MASNKNKVPVRYGSARAAKDVKIENIIDYLCDSGPSLCSSCPSKCAYGIRYLKEYDLHIQKNKHA